VDTVAADHDFGPWSTIQILLTGYTPQARSPIKIVMKKRKQEFRISMPKEGVGIDHESEVR
jgi:hypothetical protein